MTISASFKSLAVASILLCILAVSPVVAQQPVPSGNQTQTTTSSSNNKAKNSAQTSPAQTAPAQNATTQSTPQKAVAPPEQKTNQSPAEGANTQNSLPEATNNQAVEQTHAQALKNSAAREVEEKRLLERREERAQEERAEHERYEKREEAEKRAKETATEHEAISKPKEGKTPAELSALESPFEKSSKPADIIIDGKKLITIGAWIGPFSPTARVDAIEKRVIALANKRDYDPQKLKATNSIYTCDITSGEDAIMSVSNADARYAGADNRQSLAEKYVEILRDAIEEHKNSHTFKSLMFGVLLTAATTVGLALMLAATGWLLNYFSKSIHSWRGTYIKSVKFQRATLLSEDALIELASELVLLLRIFIIGALLLIYSTLVLSYFPDTREISGQLLAYMLTPVMSVVVPSITNYLPNLAFIAIIVLVAHYFIKLARFTFTEIEKGNITFAKFDQEWAQPSFGLVRFLVICFAFALIFPYLPGSGSPAFNQISLFVGVLVSLGSSGAISHIAAGVFLIYTSAFKTGDRVTIANTTGDVVEKSLLATRIRTTKNEMITIPNGLILSSQIINFSASANDAGLILHTSVTIGYDMPWRTVHKLLIEAALATDDILSEPAPFVLQIELDDFFVKYEINAYTLKSHSMTSLYSNLHSHIQSKFNEAGVEIMSPHYSSLRDGNATTVPQDSRPPGYQPLPFNLKIGPENLFK